MTPAELKKINANDVIYRITENNYIEEIYCVGDITFRSAPERIEKVFHCSSNNELVRVSQYNCNNFYFTELEATQTALEQAKRDQKSTMDFLSIRQLYLSDRLKELERGKS